MKYLMVVAMSGLFIALPPFLYAVNVATICLLFSFGTGKYKPTVWFHLLMNLITCGVNRHIHIPVNTLWVMSLC